MNSTQPPVTLRLASVECAPHVTGSVMLALALKAGFPPLAADRASRLAAQAVRTAAQPLELGAWAGAGEVTLRVTGDGDGWQARTAETLAAHAPTLADGNVSVVFRSPPRDALEQV